MKNMIMSTLAVVAVAVLLTGCSGDVSMVKNGTLPGFKSLTIGKALGNYPCFTSTKWEVIETQNKTKVVQFRGVMKLENLPPLLVNEQCQEAVKKAKKAKKNISLLAQFTINSDHSFNLSFLGAGWDEKGQLTSVPVENPEAVLKDLYAGEQTMEFRVLDGYLSWYTFQPKS